MQEPTLGVRNAQWMVSWKLLSERPVRSQRSVLKLEGRSYPRPGGSNQHESIPTNIQDVYPGNENTIVTSFSIGGILVGQTQGKEISVNLTYRYFGTCILYRRCVEPPTNLRALPMISGRVHVASRKRSCPVRDERSRVGCLL